MSAIHQYGLIWKDRQPGVWTAFSKDIPHHVYNAVEVDPETLIADTEEGATILGSVPVALSELTPIHLADLTVIVVGF